MIKTCISCGKEFETFMPHQKYCSNECRVKYHNKKRAKARYCLNCGNKLKNGHYAYCSKECAEQYIITNPKYKKVCIYCGKEFGTNKKTQKLCSVDCQHEYEKMRNAEEREKEFKEKLESKYPNFEYVSGYTNWKGYVVIRCKRCGHKQEKSAQLVKPSYKYEIICNRCLRLKVLRKKLVNLIARKRNSIIRERNEVIREKELEQQQHEREELLNNRVCKECGGFFNANNIRQYYCSNECRIKSENRIRDVKRRKQLSQNGSIDWSITLPKLIERDNNTCYICGGKCDKEDYRINKSGHTITGNKYPSIDHVIPVSKGGTHTWDNVKLAHFICNSLKADKLVSKLAVESPLPENTRY